MRWDPMGHQSPANRHGHEATEVPTAGQGTAQRSYGPSGSNEAASTSAPPGKTTVERCRWTSKRW